MGGRSSSDQRTSNSQSTANIANDGALAGANNSTLDESDNSVNDSGNTELRIDDSFNETNEFDNSINDAFNNESDNSINDAFNDESDNSVNDSFNTTNEFRDESDSSVNNSGNTSTEVRTDISNQFEDNSDNSVDNSIRIDNDGEFAGNNGTINFVDAGAIGAIQDVANNAVFASENVAQIVANSANGAIDSSLGIIANLSNGLASEINANAQTSIQEVVDFGSAAINSIGAVNQASLDEINRNSGLAFQFGNSAIDALAENQSAALVENSLLIGGLATNLQQATEQTIDSLNTQAALFQSGLQAQSQDFSDNVTRLNQLTNDSNNRVLTAISDNAASNTQTISNLAAATSTGGQTVVAEASQNIALGLVVVVGFIGVAFALNRRRK